MRVKVAGGASMQTGEQDRLAVGKRNYLMLKKRSGNTNCCWTRKMWAAGRRARCTLTLRADRCGSVPVIRKKHCNGRNHVALNILVVDDSSVVRRVILKSLRLSGCELGTLHEAANGEEGLEVMAGTWIDIAFVDINMPRMDGEEMIRRIRQNPIWADLPIVVVSTEGSETRVERLKQMGARFIHKPFPPEAIRQVVQEITGAKHELNA